MLNCPATGFSNADTDEYGGPNIIGTGGPV